MFHSTQRKSSQQLLLQYQFAGIVWPCFGVQYCVWQTHSLALDQTRKTSRCPVFIPNCSHYLSEVRLASIKGHDLWIIRQELNVSLMKNKLRDITITGEKKTPEREENVWQRQKEMAKRNGSHQPSGLRGDWGLIQCPRWTSHPGEMKQDDKDQWQCSGIITLKSQPSALNLSCHPCAKQPSIP